MDIRQVSKYASTRGGSRTAYVHLPPPNDFFLGKISFSVFCEKYFNLKIFKP